MTYLVYILRCNDDTLYCGITNDLDRRIKQHTRGPRHGGAKYLAGRSPFVVVYTEYCDSKGHALRREHEIKRKSRQQKLEMAKMWQAGQ